MPHIPHPTRRRAQSRRAPSRRASLVAAGLGLLALVAASCSVGTDGDDTATDGAASRRDGSSSTTTSTAGGGDGQGESAGGQEGGSEQPEEPEGALLLIMDASGSMNETDAGGRPRLDAAKDALHDVVDSLPEGLHAGLRVFGHRYPNTDRENGCRDTELIAPVEPLDRDTLHSAIDGYQARGYTPIGLSLQEGGNDLPPEGARSIVLVSDGEDTCGSPDPCQVAQQLRADGAEVVVHTVGVALGDDQAARDQLSCVAESGGGDFVEVEDVGDLAGTLNDVVERESRRYETSGLTLEGAPIPREANTGTVGTAHVDVAANDETNYYRFEIEPGSQVQAEFIQASNPDFANDITLTCNASVALTDGSADILSGMPDTQVGSANEALVARTPPTVVDDDEVFVETKPFCTFVPATVTFDVELRLTVVD